MQLSKARLHKNNFGCLRLLFATLVLVSHAPQELDGSLIREPLMMIFHTVTLGQVAVAGFFIISGYLVSGSLLSSGSFTDYFRKRILRIYPAFIAASLVCLVIIAPLVSAVHNLSLAQVRRFALEMMLLLPPGGRGEFTDVPWSMLDVPMWTIGYEFRCYIALALLAAFGLLRHRQLVLGLTMLLILARAVCVGFGYHVSFGHSWAAPLLYALAPDPDQALYLSGLFFGGVSFHLFAAKILLTGVGAVCCALAVGTWFCSPLLCDIGLALFFPYLIFWFALKLQAPILRRINGNDDISYGVYLYAWPISWLIIEHHPRITPAVLSLFTFAGAATAGYLSWRFIEKPALRWKDYKYAALEPGGIHLKRTITEPELP